ncbi:hypothetical protein GJ496_000884 [Pomphorhynchus laevis]|nr:hypothetical protein GJ496_000884 [Pomphorhynchus laevis]
MIIIGHNEADVKNGVTRGKIVIINTLDVRTVQVNTHRSNAINTIKGGALTVDATIVLSIKSPQFKAFYLWFQDKNKDTVEDSARNTNDCTRIENGTKLNTYAEMASLYTEKTDNGCKDMINEIHELSLSRRFELFQEHILKVVTKRITDALNNIEKKIGTLLQNLSDSISGESINQKINSIVNVNDVSV